jgi:hypothetical protein
MEHLGYRCDGATKLRSQFNQLRLPLETCIKVAANGRGEAYKVVHCGNLEATMYTSRQTLDGQTKKDV